MYSQEILKNGLASTKREASPAGKGNSLPVRRLQARMRSLHGSFLDTLSTAIDENPSVAQELAVLSRQLTSLKSLSPEWSKATNLCCMECTGIKNENFIFYSITKFLVTVPLAVVTVTTYIPLDNAVVLHSTTGASKFPALITVLPVASVIV